MAKITRPVENDIDEEVAKGISWISSGAFGNHSNEERKRLDQDSAKSKGDPYRGIGNKDTLVNFRTTKKMARNITNWAKASGLSKAAFIEEACIAFAKSRKITR